MKKIDIHCHTTNRKIKDVAEVDASLIKLHERMGTHNVEYTVVLATYFPHKKSGISNFRLHNWVRNFNKTCDQFFMFGSLDFEYYFNQGYNELEELASMNAIKGIKIYTCYQDISIHHPNFTKLMEFAQDRKLPVMFHAGVSYAAYRKYNQQSIHKLYTADELEGLSVAYPDINFIFSHLSKPNFKGMTRVAKEHPNVYSDMSGIIDSKYDRNEIPDCIENIKIFLNECGSEKLLFGTDFPVQTHEDSIMFIEKSMKTFSKKEKENVYYNNAGRILRL